MARVTEIHNERAYHKGIWSEALIWAISGTVVEWKHVLRKSLKIELSNLNFAMSGLESHGRGT